MIKHHDILLQVRIKSFETNNEAVKKYPSIEVVLDIHRDGFTDVMVQNCELQQI